MDQYRVDYFKRRERAERAAAKQATCPQARRAHQEMAQLYADLATRHSVEVPMDSPMPSSRVTILAPSHSRA